MNPEWLNIWHMVILLVRYVRNSYAGLADGKKKKMLFSLLDTNLKNF